MSSRNTPRPLSRRQLIQDAMAGAAGVAALATVGTQHAGAANVQLTPLLPAASLQGDRVSILHWSHPLIEDDMTVFDPLIERFQDAGNNIDVEIEIVPWDGRIERKMSAAFAGTSPDTSYLNVDEFTTYVEEGALVALDDYVTDEVRSDFLPGPRDAMSWEESIYEIPVLHAFRVAYYNKDVWEQSGLDPDEPPVTWPEVDEAMQAIMTAREQGVHEAWPTAMEGSGELTNHRNFNPWFYQAGGELITEDGQSGYDSPAGIEAAEWATHLFRNFTSPGDRASTGDDRSDRFGQGQFAYVNNEELRYMQFWADEYPDLNFDIAPIQINELRWTHGGVGCYGIWTPSEKRDATWKWIEFLTGEGNLEFNQGFNYFPPRESIREEFLETASPLMSKALETQEYAGVEKHPRVWDMWNIISPELQAAFAGSKSGEEAVQDAAERINSDVLNR